MILLLRSLCACISFRRRTAVSVVVPSSEPREPDRRATTSAASSAGLRREPRQRRGFHQRQQTPRRRMPDALPRGVPCRALCLRLLPSRGPDEGSAGGRTRKEATRHRREITKLEDTRRRLVEGHLANSEAIPLDVLEEKHAVSLPGLPRRTRCWLARRGISRCGAWPSRDPRAAPRAMSAWDEADRNTAAVDATFFQRLFVTERGTDAAELSSPYADRLADDLVAARCDRSRAPARCRGFDFRAYMEAGGTSPNLATASRLCAGHC